MAKKQAPDMVDTAPATPSTLGDLMRINQWTQSRLKQGDAVSFDVPFYAEESKEHYQRALDLFNKVQQYNIMRAMEDEEARAKEADRFAKEQDYLRTKHGQPWRDNKTDLGTIVLHPSTSASSYDPLKDLDKYFPKPPDIKTMNTQASRQKPHAPQAGRKWDDQQMHSWTVVENRKAYDLSDKGTVINPGDVFKKPTTGLTADITETLNVNIPKHSTGFQLGWTDTAESLNSVDAFNETIKHLHRNIPSIESNNGYYTLNGKNYSLKNFTRLVKDGTFFRVEGDNVVIDHSKLFKKNANGFIEYKEVEYDEHNDRWRELPDTKISDAKTYKEMRTFMRGYEEDNANTQKRLVISVNENFAKGLEDGLKEAFAVLLEDADRDSMQRHIVRLLGGPNEPRAIALTKAGGATKLSLPEIKNALESVLAHHYLVTEIYGLNK